MKHGLATLTLLLGLLLGAVPAAAADDLVVKSKKAKFDDVRENVVMAIENRGMKIDHQSYIADMLERTGKDIGATRKVYVRGDQIQFCKADLSRAMMEADPRNIVYCPFSVSVYTLPRDPDTVYVAYRRPQAPSGSPATRKALLAIEKMLDEIAREGLE